LAVDRQLAFPNGQAAAQAIPQSAPNYNHIELKWRDALRIDVLTDNLCMIASSYTDVIEPRPASRACRGTQTGYFTGLAEMRNGPVAISRFPLVGAGGFRQSPITLRRDPPVRNPSHKFLRDFRFAGLPGLDRPRFAKTSSVVFSARLPPVTGN
jgi:hypothetical protein